MSRVLIDPVAEEVVDLSDLDLLDDDRNHCFCSGCPDYTEEPGVVRIALCGERVITWHRPRVRTGPPPGACENCVDLYDEPCRRCGS